jgi:hypothetical protein
MVRKLSVVAAMGLLGLGVATARAQWSSVGYQQGNQGGGTEANEYQLDDGVAENSIGLTNGGSFAWLTKFTATPGNTLIRNIKVAFGTPLTINGLPVTAYLWSDPNNDGSPADAQVLAQATGIITGGNASVPINNPTFVNFDIPDTTRNVGQNFFIGVIVQHLAGQFPAAIDQTPPLPGAGVTWGAFNTTPVDPNNLGGNNLTDFVTLTGLHGKWLIRADAGVPEPSCLALVGLAGLAGLRRRR